MRGELDQPDAVIALIAARQHGVVTFAQLMGADLTKGGIDRRVASGRLHRIHRGVYAVGHLGLSNEGRWMAAVLACGPAAFLSHRSAAELWTMLPARTGPVHLTVARSGRAKRSGLVIHRSSSLPKAQTTRRNGIAVTTPARTIVDLRRTEPRAVVAKALRTASFRGWEVGNEGDDAGAWSELERRFLRFCRRYRLGKPEVNVPVGRYRVDFLWRAANLVVETDGWRAHRGRQAFEDDRARDLRLRSLGLDVVRLTWRQLEGDPDAIAALLRRYLE